MSAAAPTAPGARAWPRVVLIGLAYFVIGFVTAALSRGAATRHGVLLWRWVAWLSSAALFAGQIRYERSRGAPVTRGAAHAALAVAVGGFLLAVSATVHALTVGSARLAPQLIALVAWPLLLGGASFLVAWVAAALLARTRVG